MQPPLGSMLAPVGARSDGARPLEGARDQQLNLFSRVGGMILEHAGAFRSLIAMIKAKRSLRIALSFATYAARRLIGLPEMLAEVIERHALHH